MLLPQTLPAKFTQPLSTHCSRSSPPLLSLSSPITQSRPAHPSKSTRPSLRLCLPIRQSLPGQCLRNALSSLKLHRPNSISLYLPIVRSLFLHHSASVCSLLKAYLQLTHSLPAHHSFSACLLVNLYLAIASGLPAHPSKFTGPIHSASMYPSFQLYPSTTQLLFAHYSKSSCSSVKVYPPNPLSRRCCTTMAPRSGPPPGFSPLRSHSGNTRSCRIRCSPRIYLRGR